MLMYAVIRIGIFLVGSSANLSDSLGGFLLWLNSLLKVLLLYSGHKLFVHALTMFKLKFLVIN